MVLLTMIRKLKAKSKEMRLLVLGLDNAGKTTILKRINNQDISQIAPTLGFNIQTLVHRGYTINMWDIGGQSSLRPYWRNYYEKTDAIIWVVDSTDTMRMQDCKRELDALLQEEKLLGASLLVFTNKQDIQGAMSPDEIEAALDLQSIKTHHWQIQPCSAVTGAGLLRGLDWATMEVSKRLYYGDAITDQAVLDAKEPAPGLARLLSIEDG